MPTARTRAPQILAFALFLATGSATAQTRPFPHPGGYVAGFVPKTGAVNEARASYDFWKSKYLKSDCGAGLYRVDNSQGATFSEGMGYGMVLTAYFGDKAEFDGLWKFVQKNFNSNGVMGWHVTCAGFTDGDGGGASATDGDLDIGFALVVAVDQWGAAYKKPALDYLQTLKTHDFTTCSPSGRFLSTNGDWDKGCTTDNTSYFMPAYYRAFSRFAADPQWMKAADDAIAVWLANMNAKSGLIANEVDQNGKLGSPPKDYVDYNGCRIPWRAALDYLWHGTSGAKQVTDKMTAWANTIGIAKLVDGYNTDGTPSAAGLYTGMNPWVGGFTAGAMTYDQTAIDNFFSDFKGIDNDNGVYYGASLRALYLLMLSGNQWEPAMNGGSSSGDGGGPSSTSAGGGSAVGAGGSAGASGVGKAGGPASAGGGANQGTAASLDGGSSGKGKSANSGNCGCVIGATTSSPLESVFAALVAFAAFTRAGLTCRARASRTA
jgi:endo-1,4-beta-D-glucanase Y